MYQSPRTGNWDIPSELSSMKIYHAIKKLHLNIFLTEKAFVNHVIHCQTS